MREREKDREERERGDKSFTNVRVETRGKHSSGKSEKLTVTKLK